MWEGGAHTLISDSQGRPSNRGGGGFFRGSAGRTDAGDAGGRGNGDGRSAGAPRPSGLPGAEPSGHLTIWLSLKIGRMMLIAMNPTMPPISTIISGSIIAVTLLITCFSSRL